MSCRRGGLILGASATGCTEGTHRALSSAERERAPSRRKPFLASASCRSKEAEQIKKLRSEIRLLKSRLASSNATVERLMSRIGRMEEPDTAEGETAESKKHEKPLRELQKQLKDKDEELRQSSKRLNEVDKELVDAQSSNRDLKETQAQLKSRIRTLEAALEEADGALLCRLQKILGITAVRERSQEEVDKLRDGLRKQVKSKERPHHWKVGLLDSVKFKRQQIESIVTELSEVEVQRLSLQSEYIKAKAKLDKRGKQKTLAEVTVSSQQGFKTELCVFFKTDSCTKGKACTFAHGEAELIKSGSRQSDACSNDIETDSRLKEFQDLNERVKSLKSDKRQLEAEICKFEMDDELHQYNDALQAAEDVCSALGEQDFASKLFNPGVPTKEDRRDIKPDSTLFRFVKGLMLRSLTHSRLSFHSNEWCQLAQYDIIHINACINPELSTRYKFEQLKLAQKHPDGVKLPGKLHALELDSSVGELALFHGCREEVVPQILQQGFDFRIAGRNKGTMFGAGTYFAEQLGGKQGLLYILK